MLTLQQLLSTIAPVNLSLKSKPLSSYTESLNQNIEAIFSQLNSITIHREKFNQIAKYLQTIKQLIFSNQSMHISLPFAKHIEVFNSDLSDIYDLSLKCVDYYVQRILNDQPFASTWEIFLRFWLSSLKFLTFIDQNQFFDLIPLCNAHMNDLIYIKTNLSSSMSQERLEEIIQTLALDPEDLDFKVIKSQEFLNKTPFSLNFKASIDNTPYTLEVFNPEFDTAIIHRKYVTMLSQLIHPNIVPFCKSSKTLPYSILSPYYQKGTLASHLHISMTDGDGNPYTSSDLSPTRLSIILLDTARALEYLHSRKICHRNINPNNIYLSNNYSAVVNGMWNICNEPIIEKDIPFSPYIAPEVLLDPSCYNEKSDVYSFTYLVWELYHNQIPFGDISSYAAKNEIIYQDLRPHLPSNPDHVNFFICGWLRNPDNRPTMTEIVQSIENKEILVPGTDENQFSSYVESTRRSHNAALKGILQLQIGNLKQLESIDRLDDKSIELLLNVFIDSQDIQMRDLSKQLLLKNLERTQNLSLKSLVQYCHLSLIIPSIQQHVLSICHQLPDRKEFVRLLFTTIEKSQAIKFLILLGLQENECELVLEAGCSQAPEIAEKAAHAVVSSFPHSSYIFDYAKKNPVYYEIALQYIKSLDDESLNRMSKRIILFADGASDQVLNDLNLLVMRIDIDKNPDFDPNCLLFKLLAENDYVDTIAKFAHYRVYCSRFVQKLLPNLVTKNPDVALMIVLEARSFHELDNDVKKVNVLKLITLCISQKNFDIAFKAAAKLQFTPDILRANFDLAEEICKYMIDFSNDENVLSMVHFTLFPYVLYSDWNKDEKVIEITSKLLQSNSETIASRALTFAVAFSQNKAVAKAMASQINNLIAASKFLDSQTSQFVYLTVRFVANLAPFINANDHIEGIVRKEMELANYTYANNPRMVTIILQSFLLFQKIEWGQLSSKCGAMEFVYQLESSNLYNNNNAIMNLINKLKTY